MAGSELFTDLALLVGSETWPERWQVASCRRQRVLEGAVACFRPKFFVEPQPVSWLLRNHSAMRISSKGSALGQE